MKTEQDVRRLGGAVAALVALSHLLLGASRLLTDPEANNLWQAFLQGPGVGRYLLLVIALLLLAVLPAVEALFEGVRAQAGWLSQVALLGIFATVLARVQDANVSVLFYSVDAQGWLGVGCLVTWAAGVGLLAWRRKVLPAWLCLAALAWAGLLAGALVAGMFWNDGLVRTLLLLTCFAAAPAWFGGLAGVLLRGDGESGR